MAGAFKETQSNGFRFVLLEDDGVARNLFEGKIWEPHFLELTKIFVQPGQTVCDAGANFGYHTLQLARCVGNAGKVFAFEPQRLVFQQLCFHVFMNFAGNVHAYPIALGAEPGKSLVGELSEVDLSNIGSTAIGKGSHQIEVSTLDSFADSAKFSFIKVDIQGSESNFLRGAQKVIARDRPIIFLEVEENWLREFGSSSKELIEMVLAMGYSLLRIETEWPSDHLCFPNERKDEVLAKLANFQWPLRLLEGKEVELTFAGKPYYESIEILR